MKNDKGGLEKKKRKQEAEPRENTGSAFQSQGMSDAWQVFYERVKKVVQEE